MIGDFGVETTSVDSQTLNGHEATVTLLNGCVESPCLVGHFW